MAFEVVIQQSLQQERRLKYPDRTSWFRHSDIRDDDIEMRAESLLVTLSKAIGAPVTDQQLKGPV